MNKEEKDILEFLLSIYEKSNAYKNDISDGNRILMTFYGKGKSHFKMYKIENSPVRNAYNEACEDLKRQGLIDFSWLYGNENNIIHQAWLIISQISEVYCLVGRTVKSDYINDVICKIINAQNNVAEGYFSDCISKWKNDVLSKKNVGKFLPDDINQIEQYLDVIVAVSRHDDNEVLERVFSKRVLNDSKTFEKLYRHRLIALIKKYDCSTLDIKQFTDTEVLRSVGIVKYPEILAFCGGLTINNNGVLLDFQLFKNGAYICAKDCKECDIYINKSIKSVLTIENKANYYDYIVNHKNDSDLVIYHGGYYSPVKGLFFKKLVKSADKSVHWFHWGDIDYGGFSMLKRLRLNVNENYKPYKMGLEELLEYKNYCQSFSDDYSNKLCELQKDVSLKDCSDTLKYMIDNNVKLEQEAII